MAKINTPALAMFLQGQVNACAIGPEHTAERVGNIMFLKFRGQAVLSIEPKRILIKLPPNANGSRVYGRAMCDMLSAFTGGLTCKFTWPSQIQIGLYVAQGTKPGRISFNPEDMVMCNIENIRKLQNDRKAPRANQPKY